MFEGDDRRFCKTVVHTLSTWWHAACHHFNKDDEDVDGDGDVDEEDVGLNYLEYADYYRRLVYAFNQMSEEEHALDVEDAAHSLAMDWAADSRGDGHVDKDDFYNSVYELALAWTAEDANDQEICGYLDGLYPLIFDVDQKAVDTFLKDWIVEPEVVVDVAQQQGMGRARIQHRLLLSLLAVNNGAEGGKDCTTAGSGEGKIAGDGEPEGVLEEVEEEPEESEEEVENEVEEELPPPVHVAKFSYKRKAVRRVPAKKPCTSPRLLPPPKRAPHDQTRGPRAGRGQGDSPNAYERRMNKGFDHYKGFNTSPKAKRKCATKRPKAPNWIWGQNGCAGVDKVSLSPSDKLPSVSMNNQQSVSDAEQSNTTRSDGNRAMNRHETSQVSTLCKEKREINGVLFELAVRSEGTGITVHAVNPTGTPIQTLVMCEEQVASVSKQCGLQARSTEWCTHLIARIEISNKGVISVAEDYHYNSSNPSLGGYREHSGQAPNKEKPEHERIDMAAANGRDTPDINSKSIKRIIVSVGKTPELKATSGSADLAKIASRCATDAVLGSEVGSEIGSVVGSGVGTTAVGSVVDTREAEQGDEQGAEQGAEQFPFHELGIRSSGQSVLLPRKPPPRHTLGKHALRVAAVAPSHRQLRPLALSAPLPATLSPRCHRAAAKGVFIQSNRKGRRRKKKLRPKKVNIRFVAVSKTASRREKRSAISSSLTGASSMTISSGRAKNLPLLVLEGLEAEPPAQRKTLPALQIKTTVAKNAVRVSDLALLGAVATQHTPALAPASASVDPSASASASYS